MERNVSLQNEITDEIIFEITKLVKAIDGVSRLSKNKGIRLDENNIDISLVIEFGIRIPELAWNIQTTIKKLLREKYNIRPKSINIHVQGVADVK
jgi:uncharacterized alkaline shock family protein YloU